MLSGVVPPWPVLGSLAGGVGALWLAWLLVPYREKPGVDWFLLVFAAQATWCLSYGAGLLTSDPLLRVVLETATWLGIVWTGVAFLGFALEYTGRPEVIRSRLFVSVVGFGLVSTALLVTNPIHGAYWAGFRIDPVSASRPPRTRSARGRTSSSRPDRCWSPARWSCSSTPCSATGPCTAGRPPRWR